VDSGFNVELIAMPRTYDIRLTSLIEDATDAGSVFAYTFAEEWHYHSLAGRTRKMRTDILIRIERTAQIEYPYLK
jgi:hypothetical protein